METCFLDTTCVAANIHCPVDWVLLRDATRTLMKAVKLTREQGLKHRMEAPESFITRINRLCIEMTHARTKPDSNRHRKITLRKMDRVVGMVGAHARRYRKLLDESISGKCRVIVRKKAGAEVEFGNTLLLGERIYRA